jgi:hypothetical protein
MNNWIIGKTIVLEPYLEALSNTKHPNDKNHKS